MLAFTACAQTDGPTPGFGGSPTPGSDEQAPGPTKTPAPTPTDTPTPEPVRTGLNPGESGIYMTVSAGSSSSFVRGIEIEKSYRAVVLYVPATDEAIVLDTYTSPGYAPNVRRPYTVDDRLFINTEWTDSGGLDFKEFDPETSVQIVAVDHSSGGDADERAITAVDDHVYYWSSVERFGQSSLRYLTRASLQARSSERVGSAQGGGTLFWAGSSLYGITTPFESSPDFNVYRIDPRDATATTQDEFEVTTFDGYLSGSFADPAAVGGTAYWVSGTAVGSSTEFTVWQYDLTTGGGITELLTFTAAVAPSFIIQFDVDDDVFLVHARKQGVLQSVFVLHDADTGETSVHDLGVNAIDADVLKLG